MLCHSCRLNECSITYFAFVWFFSGVYVQMLLQSTGLTEGFITHFTFEWLLTSMTSHVPCEITFLLKYVLTYFAFIYLLTCAHMLITHVFAVQWFYTCITCLMYTYMAFKFKTSLSQNLHLRFFSPVCTSKCLRYFDWVKDSRQAAHLYSFFSVWIRLCWTRSPELAKEFSHLRFCPLLCAALFVLYIFFWGVTASCVGNCFSCELHFWGFISFWVHLWRDRPVLWTVYFLQTLHLCDVIPLWQVKWFWWPEGREQDMPHLLHLYAFCPLSVCRCWTDWFDAICLLPLPERAMFCKATSRVFTLVSRPPDNSWLSSFEVFIFWIWKNSSELTLVFRWDVFCMAVCNCIALLFSLVLWISVQPDTGHECDSTVQAD